MDFIEEASKVYEQHFPSSTWFERALFFSWACGIEKTCTYCYMSTLPLEKRTKDKVRSFASIYAETLIARECGWRIGFLSGGIGVFTPERLGALIKGIYAITGKKIWLNTGNMPRKHLEMYAPYVRGVIGTVECVNEKVHAEVCPGKPVSPILRMFDDAKAVGLVCGMTIIIGLGETIEDFPKLEAFIRKHDIKKIHMYGLNPQEGTVFEKAKPPSAEYQAEWIARTRIAFPELDIQCGIWSDRPEYIPLLLRAGANSISKFPALRAFGKEPAKAIEQYAREAGRSFEGTLTKLPDVDWDAEIEQLPFDTAMKENIKKKLISYLQRMKKHADQ